MNGNAWTKNEEDIINIYYEKLSKEEILKLIPNHTWAAICVRACSMGYNRRKISYQLYRKGNLENLLNGSLESYYWLGFLLADGHFSNRGAISLHLNELDNDHIQKYADFINGKVRYHKKRVIVDIQAPEICQEICEKFNTNNRKTYNCPKLPEMTDNQFISLISGLIDGDGNMDIHRISGGCCIRIKCHLSWADFYQKISERISKLSKTPMINVCKGKFMVLRISNNSALSFLKNKTEELNLPILKRKWDKIDGNKISQYDSAKRLNQEINALKNDGKLVKEIALILNISIYGVYSSLRRTYKYKDD